MRKPGGDPWKLTAIGMSAVVVTALITGLVVAGWTGTEGDRVAADPPAVRRSESSAKPARVVSTAPATPSKSAIEACNRYAASETDGHRNTPGKMVQVVTAGGGTLYGLNENRKWDDRYRSAYSSCMRSRGYVS